MAKYRVRYYSFNGHDECSMIVEAGSEEAAVQKVNETEGREIKLFLLRGVEEVQEGRGMNLVGHYRRYAHRYGR